MIVRTILFCVITLMAIGGPFVMFVIGLVAYTLLYAGVEVIILMACVDAYYGLGETYYNTLATGLFVFVVSFLQPRLWVYNR